MALVVLLIKPPEEVQELGILHDPELHHPELTEALDVEAEEEGI